MPPLARFANVVVSIRALPPAVLRRFTAAFNRLNTSVPSVRVASCDGANCDGVCTALTLAWLVARLDWCFAECCIQRSRRKPPLVEYSVVPDSQRVLWTMQGFNHQCLVHWPWCNLGVGLRVMFCCIQGCNQWGQRGHVPPLRCSKQNTFGSPLYPPFLSPVSTRLG